MLVTAPARELGLDELLALRRYRNAGGAVVLLGSAAATDDHVGNLNHLAKWLNTDLRFNDDAVVDETNNLADEPSILETTALDDGFSLFDSYEPSDGEPGESHPGRGRGPGRPPPSRARGKRRSADALLVEYRHRRNRDVLRFDTVITVSSVMLRVGSAGTASRRG